MQPLTKTLTRARFCRALTHERDGVGTVRHRRGVGHGEHAGESTCSGGARAAGDRFLLASARLAQMHMHVDEAGRDDSALSANDWHADRRGGDVGNDAVFDQQVADFIPTGCGIDDAAAANEDRTGETAEEAWGIVRVGG